MPGYLDKVVMLQKSRREKEEGQVNGQREKRMVVDGSLQGRHDYLTYVNGQYTFC